jgi:eukaryotic-like serine/threonine-protein kinase
VPDGWTDRRSGSIVCFSNPNGGFLSVSQWQPPDTNMVAYWTARERVVSSTLTDYQRVGIAKKDLYQAAAEWEFTFAIEGERYHASAVALVSAGQAYAIIWCTRELDWSSRLADLSRVTGAGFQPAR